MEGTRSGTETRYVRWARSGTVRVPLSVFEEGEDAVEEYVKEEVDDMNSVYGDTLPTAPGRRGRSRRNTARA